MHDREAVHLRTEQTDYDQRVYDHRIYEHRIYEHRIYDHRVYDHRVYDIRYKSFCRSLIVTSIEKDHVRVTT